MINITNTNGLVIDIDGDKTRIPSNIIIAEVENDSDIVAFKTTKGYSIVQGLIGEIQVNGEAVTKDNILDKLEVLYTTSSSGGGGGTDTAEIINEINNIING